jgi:hypothetical protein
MVAAKIPVLFGLAVGDNLWCMPFVVFWWWLNAKGCRGFRRRQPFVSTLT